MKEEEGERKKEKGESDLPHAFAFSLSSSSFNEIGAARPDELETVLRAMCAAFELPLDVARPIFYNDPYLDPANKLVLRAEDGRIVSCLTLNLAQCRIGNAVVPTAGISGVATLPDERRKGYAGHLLQYALSVLAERNSALAGLYPYDYAYYRRWGWETASTGYRYVTVPAHLPCYPEANAVRPARADDWSAIAALHEQQARAQTLSCVRDAKRWQYVQQRIPPQQVFVGADGSVEGYLLYEMQPGRMAMGSGQPEVPPGLNVLEWCAATPSARRGLLGWLAAQPQIGRIEYLAAWHDLERAGLTQLPIALAAGETIAHVLAVPTLMLRIVDFARLLIALRSNWAGFDGSVMLTLRDELRTQPSVSVLIAGNGNGLPRVETVSRPVLFGQALPHSRNADSERDCGECIEGDVRAWSQVVVGHFSGDDACALGRLTASTPLAARLAGWLFPARFPFLPGPDHF